MNHKGKTKVNFEQQIEKLKTLNEKPKNILKEKYSQYEWLFVLKHNPEYLEDLPTEFKNREFYDKFIKIVNLRSLFNLSRQQVADILNTVSINEINERFTKSHFFDLLYINEDLITKNTIISHIKNNLSTYNYSKLKAFEENKLDILNAHIVELTEHINKTKENSFGYTFKFIARTIFKLLIDEPSFNSNQIVINILNNLMNHFYKFPNEFADIFIGYSSDVELKQFITNEGNISLIKSIIQENNKFIEPLSIFLNINDVFNLFLEIPKDLMNEYVFSQFKSAIKNKLDLTNIRYKLTYCNLVLVEKILRMDENNFKLFGAEFLIKYISENNLVDELLSPLFDLSKDFSDDEITFRLNLIYKFELKSIKDLSDLGRSKEIMNQFVKKHLNFSLISYLDMRYLFNKYITKDDLKIKIAEIIENKKYFYNFGYVFENNSELFSYEDILSMLLNNQIYIQDVKF